MLREGWAVKGRGRQVLILLQGYVLCFGDTASLCAWKIKDAGL